MRSPLGKECRKLFLKMMAVEFPDYKQDKTQVNPSGWYAWKHEHQSGLFFWIFLVIHNSSDQFTTEAGWSFDANTPPWEMIGRNEMEKILSKPLAFRTCRLWCEGNWGFWWKLVLRPEEHERAIFYKDDPVEQCLPLVAPAVWDAGEKLKEHVIPVFEKVI
ncbi:MAG TPA: hypothetical protein VGI88_06515, partial [Verrucomicrobiae bacterium]